MRQKNRSKETIYENSFEGKLFRQKESKQHCDI